MKKLILFILGLALTTFNSVHSEVYTGNGNSGFGGAVGGGSLEITDNDIDTVTFKFTRGAGSFSDALVIYFDTEVGGATSLPASGEIGSPDGSRRAIVNEYGSGIDGFPSGADYAFSIRTNDFNNYFDISSGGDADDLVYKSSPSVSNFTSSSASEYVWTLSFADLGITSTSTINFAVTYLNPYGGAGSDATFRSDESFVTSITGGNPEFDGITFSEWNAYTVPEPQSFALLAGLTGLAYIALRRRY